MGATVLESGLLVATVLDSGLLVATVLESGLLVATVRDSGLLVKLRKFEQGQTIKLRPSILGSLLLEDINKIQQEIDMVIKNIYVLKGMYNV